MQSELKLSDLKNGQFFTFRNGQIAKYVMKPNNLCDLKTNDWIEYEVIKMNEMSVKCRTKSGSLEYTFKFKGYLQNITRKTKNLENICGIDCLVVITS